MFTLLLVGGCSLEGPPLTQSYTYDGKTTTIYYSNPLDYDDYPRVKINGTDVGGLITKTYTEYVRFYVRDNVGKSEVYSLRRYIEDRGRLLHDSTPKVKEQRVKAIVYKEITPVITKRDNLTTSDLHIIERGIEFVDELDPEMELGLRKKIMGMEQDYYKDIRKDIAVISDGITDYKKALRGKESIHLLDYDYTDVIKNAQTKLTFLGNYLEDTGKTKVLQDRLTSLEQTLEREGLYSQN